MMTSNKKQQGAAAVIIVFLLLFLIAGMVVTISIISASSVSDSTRQSDYTNAFFLAESALEKARYQLNNNITCDDPAFVDVAEVAYKKGGFQIVSATIDTPAAGNCEVLVKGSSNSVITYVQSAFENLGGTGGGGGTGSFTEHFPAFTGWTWNPTDNQGTISLDADCGPCVGSSGFSVKAITDSAASWRRLRGYGEKTLVDPIDTSAGGVTLDWSLAYKKDIVGTGNPSRHIASVELWDSGNAAGEELWSDSAKSRDNIWTVMTGIGVGLTNGRLYDRIRIHFDLRGRDNRIPVIWIDEINMSAGGGGGGAAPDWQIITWSEVNQ